MGINAPSQHTCGTILFLFHPFEAAALLLHASSDEFKCTAQRFAVHHHYRAIVSKFFLIVKFFLKRLFKQNVSNFSGLTSAIGFTDLPCGG
jgi:hypothetical protein